MVENESYMVYPNFQGSLSFSTTHADLGVHIRSSSLRDLYRVQLVPQGNQQFELKDVGDLVKFDFLHESVSRRGDGADDERARGNDGSSLQCFDSEITTRCTVRKATIEMDQKANSIIVSSPSFSSRHGKRAFRGPLLFPTFRHRCCVADIPSIVAIEGRHLRHSDACKQTEHRPTYVLAFPNFPQYWHTFHDAFMALYITLVEESGPNLHDRDNLIAVANLECVFVLHTCGFVSKRKESSACV